MDSNKLQLRKKRFLKLFAKLEELFPVKKTELYFGTPWELLVAVILSAQCTDAQVNKVTKKLFKKYKKMEEYAAAKQSDLEKDVYSTGFYRNKAKNIIAAAKVLLKDHKGIIPKAVSEAIKIPGVGRKTANVVLQNLYGINEGVAVDTHVQRFAIRYNLSDYKDPVRIERDLMKIIPQKRWRDASYYMKQYGRSFGPAKNWDKKKDPLQRVFTSA